MGKDSENSKITNFEWIKSLDEYEMAKYLLNPCDNFSCEMCPMHDLKRERCIINSAYGQGDGLVLDWLRDEHTWMPTMDE